MPPIYFQAQYNRYKKQITLFDRLNSLLQTLFFNTVTNISRAFLPVMNWRLYAMFTKICTSRDDPLSLSLLLKHTGHCDHIHCLDSINISKCQLISTGAVEEFSVTQ